MSDFPPCVIFDLDGTLVDSAPDLARALNHTLECHGLSPIPPQTVRHLVGRGARVLIEQGLMTAGETFDEAQIEGALQTFLDFYRENIALETQPFDGALDVLAQLQSAGCRMGICTNKPHDMTDKLLAALDLHRYFPVFYGADAVPSRKPHPGHLQAVTTDLGVHFSETVFVGDSPTDTATAKAAGVPCIAVSFGYSTIPAQELDADILIDHFSALPAALRQLRRCQTA